MRWKFAFLMAVLAVAVGTAAAQASQCVTCHTDAEQLKAIIKTLPPPAISAETAGKG
ncbi:MAG: hypothetical protein JXR72_06955 [Proteobacteria bacterium]|nr:hypothetical protein [Pseudomonadota bacterium]